MSERGTPETDRKERETLNQKSSTHAHYGWKFARRMERQRDEMRALWERDSKALGVAIVQRDNARAVAEDNRARYVTAEAQRDELADALRSVLPYMNLNTPNACAAFDSARALLARIDGEGGEG